MAAIPAPAHEHSMHANDRGRAKLPRPPRVEVVAITGDDALLEQIGQALDGESIIRHAETPAEARGIVSPQHPCVLLLDARGYDDLARVVEDLQSAEGTRVVVIFAPAEASDDVARAVRGSAAFAVLTIPVVQPQAAAVLGGAREESLARHALLATPPPPSVDPVPAPDAAPMPVVETDEQTAVQHERPRRAAPATRRAVVAGIRTKVIAAALALSCVVAIAGFWLFESLTVTDDRSAPQPVPLDASANPPAEVELETLQAGSVDELLDSARAAMRARRYTDPEGQNALTFYRSVLAQDPGNGEAREGLSRIAAVLHERVRSALADRRYDEASRTLAQLRSIRPDDPATVQYETTILEARISKALDNVDLERARELLQQAAKTGALPPDGIARWQTELDRQQSDARAGQLATLVSQRIRQGRLVDPANDSAKHYLGLLRRLPGATHHQRADLATTELQQAYLGKLRDAIAKAQRTEADRWKAEARALGVTATEISAVHRDVSARAIVADSRQEAARIAQLVQNRIADNKLLEPAGDSAVFHLGALRTMDPSSSAVATGERALSAKLLEQGRKALEEKRLDVARAHAAAARQLATNLETVAALERDIAAAGTTAGQPGTQPTPRLSRTRYVAPEYPAGALKKGVRGDVRVRITVDAEGRVADAVVVQSDPPEIFDAVAVAAARKWRFKAIGAKDSGVEATATVDIAFRPEDMKK
ncbi:MAG TPA: energy transducer TonB [Steroidobacteraceae bacterium]